ncbi:MAG: nuclear transport factor 2 family protein [Bacteroidota bacterium]|nr:nuclear transport factor 2 family protein [Bacteroidota bacterium]
MKKTLFLLTLLIHFVLVSYAQSGDEKQVAAAVETFKKAMISRDKNLLESITAEELSYGHSSGKVEDKAAFVNGVLNDPIHFNEIDLQDQTIRLAGNTAIVRHAFNAKTTNNGTPGEVKIRNLLIWQKQKGQWKLLARQAFRLP